MGEEFTSWHLSDPPSLLGTLLAIVLGSTPALALDALSTEWRRWEGSARACLENAQRVMKAAQFRDTFFSNGGEKDRTITAVRGQYTGAVQCVEDMKLAFFIVYGPDDKIAEQYIQELVGRF